MIPTECFMCEAGIHCEPYPEPGGEHALYHCARCGEYVVEGCLDSNQEGISDHDRFRMACVVREFRAKGEDGLFGILSDRFRSGDETIDWNCDRWWRISELQQEFPRDGDVFDRALLNMSRLVTHASERIDKRWGDWAYVLFCPVRDIMQHVQSLEELGYVRSFSKTRGEVALGVTVTGWARIKELQAEVGHGASPTPIRANQADESATDAATSPMEPSKMEQANSTRKVFVVHGHDGELRSEVCRVLDKLDLVPVVLFEQPDQGRTVIEKFEHHSDVGYAVVLLTPDDEGRPCGKEKLVRRARQNVIFELGFFYGKLGRKNVCAILKEGVQFPSDIHGVIYTPADAAGAWELKLAREIKAAGLDVDLNKLG